MSYTKYEKSGHGSTPRRKYKSRMKRGEVTLEQLRRDIARGVNHFNAQFKGRKLTKWKSLA